MPKALVLQEFKEYGDLSSLTLEEIQTPEPGPDEVRIDVDAFALNYGDFELLTGNYTFRLDLPARIGDECSGTVTAVGNRVREFRVGDRVATLPTAYGKNGVNGEVAIYPAKYCAPVPDSVSSIEACTVWVSYFTAYAALVEVAEVVAGDYVLVTAGTSNAGIAAMQLCRKLGARTIGTTRSAVRRSELLELGYDHVAVQGQDDIGHFVNTVSSGRGARVIYDPIGGRMVQEYKDAFAQDAVIFLYGGIDQSETIVPEFEMTRANATLRPFSIFNYVVQEGVRTRGIDFVNRGVSEGWLFPLIADVHDFTAWREAMLSHSESKSSLGKTVIKVR